MKRLVILFFILAFAFVIIPVGSTMEPPLNVPVYDKEKNVVTYDGEVYKPTIPPSVNFWPTIIKEGFWTEGDVKAANVFFFKGDKEKHVPRTIVMFRDANKPKEGVVFVDKDCNGTFEMKFETKPDAKFVWPDCAVGKPQSE